MILYTECYLFEGSFFLLNLQHGVFLYFSIFLSYHSSKIYWQEMYTWDSEQGYICGLISSQGHPPLASGIIEHMFSDRSATMCQVFNLSSIARESLPYSALWIECSVCFNWHLHDISASRKVGFLHLHYHSEWGLWHGAHLCGWLNWPCCRV